MLFSGAPAARRAAKRSAILNVRGKDKRNPSVDFLMVILASGIAGGRVRTTTTTTTTAELPNMAAMKCWREVSRYKSKHLRKIHFKFLTRSIKHLKCL